MRLKAMAKINLALDVIGERPDGYHDVRMVMQTIGMYDTLELTAKKEPGIRLTANLPFIPVDGRNLVWKAADLLMKEFGVSDGVRISLHKFIPVAAGLAGGSSDAAAALIGINRLFHLGLDKKELMERAVQIGADVPYCVMRGTALAEGIGEKLTPLPPVPDCAVLIGKPGISVSTKTAYQNLDMDDISNRPDIDGMIQAITDQDLEGIASRMQNVFAPGIEKQYPVIAAIRELMEKNGAIKAMMSGSGPTVFGLFPSRNQAEKAAGILSGSRLARTVHVTGMFHG